MVIQLESRAGMFAQKHLRWPQLKKKGGFMDSPVWLVLVWSYGYRILHMYVVMTWVHTPPTLDAASPVS